MNPTDQPPSAEAVKAAFAYVDQSPSGWFFGIQAYRLEHHGNETSAETAARILAAHARAKEAGAATGTEARVCSDIASRQAFGLTKYNTSIEDAGLSHKEWLNHAYLETLDKAIYLKAAIEKESGLESEVARLREALEESKDELTLTNDAIRHFAKKVPDFETSMPNQTRPTIRKALTGEASA